MKFVYIIQSDKDKSYYVGVTEDVEKRLKEHNSGSSKYSSTKLPYFLVWYCGFLDDKKAYLFERYLKAGSGMAFRNKHLI
jgi:predicted GIY-YIG superfamily endonuclease